MKREAFIKLMNNLQEFNNEMYNYSDNLAKAFGSDSAIFIDPIGFYLEKTVDIIGELVNDPDTVDWLFWESMMSGREMMTFEIEGETFIGNPENVYDLILYPKKGEK